MTSIDTYLNQLNEPQREAVLENSRPLLMLAGAGSGKTRVITTKIAYAIEVLKIPPYRILAVTFTNKAASEMKGRVEALLPDHPDVKECNIRTFHSFGAWLLRRFGSEIGLASNFTIYDDADSLALLASLYPSYKKRELEPVMKRIGYAKDRMIPPGDAARIFHADLLFKQMYERYEEKLRAVGNLDFADLIGRSIELLRNAPHVQEWVHSRFEMIMVDEYQDSNTAQFLLLKLLVGPETFVGVVGDDDQSIYRFRGAEVKNILTFASQFPKTRTIKLEQNYRSTTQILDVANSIISKNKDRHEKNLWSARKGGRKPKLFYVHDEEDEARRIVTLLREDHNYEGSAVLYRTNAQSVPFETVFKRYGIPYKVVGALQFYEREEVKDALALLYLLTNPKDEVSFRRIINKPARGIGPGSVEKIVGFTRRTDGDLLQAATLGVRNRALSSRAAKGAELVVRIIDEGRRMIREGNLVDAVTFLIRESGLYEHYQEQDHLNTTAKVANLEALVNALSAYESSFDGLVTFLEQLTLDRTTLGTDDPRDKEGVTLITMHNTKGLEFDRVFVTGLEEGLFPGHRNESDEDIQEERRIFYVAVTRARNELCLFSSKVRKIWGKTSFQQPSRFIADIDPALIRVEGSPAPGGFPSFAKRDADDAPSGWGNSGSKMIRQGFAMKVRHESRGEGPLFAVGQRVYSDAYGAGEVAAVRGEGEREVIDVVFATGKKATYLSRFAAIDRIADEQG
ncbi:MAG: UvrD-helicase domain-containing protein [Spirochaetales bacterium]|nr:UvrD-helicase domain-containing protein [Spirochaetales bacterium]